MAPTLVTSCTLLPPEGAAGPKGGLAARRAVLLAIAAGLTGCGFQLRQAPSFAFSSIHVAAPGNSPVAAELRRAIGQAGVQVTDSPAAQVVVDLVGEQREKVVVGLNSVGQVREFQLRTRIQFRLRTAGGRELIPNTELLQTRDISFNESLALAKEAEENLLYRDMQTDVVQQLMRRLAAVKTL